MIGTLEIEVQSHHPQMPLNPIVAYKNSLSNVRIIGVPKSIGQWKLTDVKVQLQYPNNTTVEKQCTRVGNVWVATVDGCSSSGKTSNGFSVIASGVDENGNEVESYTLGVGDIFILDSDVERRVSPDSYRMKLFEEMPENPDIGDAVIQDGDMKICVGDSWIPATSKDGLATEEYVDAKLEDPLPPAHEQSKSVAMISEEQKYVVGNNWTYFIPIPPSDRTSAWTDITLINIDTSRQWTWKCLAYQLYRAKVDGIHTTVERV